MAAKYAVVFANRITNYILQAPFVKNYIGITFEIAISFFCIFRLILFLTNELKHADQLVGSSRLF